MKTIATLFSDGRPWALCPSALAYLSFASSAHAADSGAGWPIAGAMPWLGGLALLILSAVAFAIGLRRRRERQHESEGGGSGQNGTGRHDAEAALRAVDEAWQRSFDALPDYVCILDIQGRIQRANRPLIERFGPIHGDVIGMDYREIYCGTPTPDPQPPCAAVLSGSPAVSVEATLTTMDG